MTDRERGSYREPQEVSMIYAAIRLCLNCIARGWDCSMAGICSENKVAGKRKSPLGLRLCGALEPVNAVAAKYRVGTVDDGQLALFPKRFSSEVCGGFCCCGSEKMMGSEVE